MSLFQFTPSPDIAMKEQVFATWEGAFSDSMIADLVKVCESPKFKRVSATINNKERKEETNTSVREATLYWISQQPETTNLYNTMAYIANQLNGQCFGFDLYGFVEDFQYTIYQAPSGHYDWHMDKGSSGMPPRKLSMVLQLSDSDEYEGGELQFMTGSEVTVAEKKKGLVHCFPSWVMHRVTPITKGTRKTIVIWCAGPRFV